MSEPTHTTRSILLITITRFRSKSDEFFDLDRYSADVTLAPGYYHHQNSDRIPGRLTDSQGHPAPANVQEFSNKLHNIGMGVTVYPTQVDVTSDRDTIENEVADQLVVRAILEMIGWEGDWETRVVSRVGQLRSSV